jgi:hypothetical protein
MLKVSPAMPLGGWRLEHEFANSVINMVDPSGEDER